MSSQVAGFAPDGNFNITIPMFSMLEKKNFFPQTKWETVTGGFNKLTSKQQQEFLENFTERYAGKPVTTEAIKCCLKSMKDFSFRIEGLSWLQKIQGDNDESTGVIVPLGKDKVTLVSVADIKNQLQ